MTKETGYLQSRRGIWEHFQDGRMTPLRFTVHQYIAAQADTRTGVWVGSAKSISVALCISERMARRELERLTKGDYIRRFPVPGKHVCYPILVHKFYPTNGEHKGEQLDAINSTSAIDLRYLPIENGKHKGEHLSPQKRIEKEEQRKKPSAKPAPPADPRHQPFVDFAFAAFKQKHGQKPTWGGKDFKALSLMLSSNKGMGVEELERRFRNYLASTELFTQKQGDALWYFCAHVDSFLVGPLMVPARKGTNGKQSVTDNISTTLETMRIAEQRAVN